MKPRVFFDRNGELSVVRSWWAVLPGQGVVCGPTWDRAMAHVRYYWRRCDPLYWPLSTVAESVLLAS